MPVNSREKGKRGEREAAALLRDCGFENAGRAQQYCGAAGTADITLKAWLHVEVKNTSRASLPQWIEQVRRDCPPGKDWVILWKRARDKWFLIAEAERVLPILAKEYKDG